MILQNIINFFQIRRNSIFEIQSPNNLPPLLYFLDLIGILEIFYVCQDIVLKFLEEFGLIFCGLLTFLSELFFYLGEKWVYLGEDLFMKFF